MSKLLTLQEMNNIAKRRGGKCLSKRYVNNQTQLKWQCKKGHVWRAVYGSIQQGTWCPVCANIKGHKKLKSNIQEMGRIAENRGGKCLSKRYINSQTHLEWQCSGGHIWKAIPNNIKRGKWCPFCGGTKKLNIAEMQNVAKERGGLCLSKKYINAITKLKWRCQKGHVWKSVPASVKAGTWCPVCAQIKRREKLKSNIQEVRRIAENRGGKCLSKWYTNNRTRLEWQCAKGHVWKAAYDNIQQGSWCPFCAGNVKLGIQEMRHIAKERGGLCLSKKYVNNQTKLKWQCKKGHVWRAVANSVKNGSWCPVCSSKISERICRTIFEQIFKCRFPSVWPDWLRNNRGNKMQLDGYCEKLKIAFEFQGPQHYKANSLMTPSIEILARRLADDKLKEKLCSDRGIALVKIDWVPKRQIQLSDIVKACKKNGVKLPKDTNKINIDLKDVHSPDKLLEAKKLAAKHYGKCLSTKFIAIKLPLIWKCQKRHVWSAPFDRIKKGVWCLACAKEHFGETLKLTMEEVRQTARRRGGVCLTKKYKNSHTKMRWQCKNGHIWEAIAHSIQRGSWCPFCGGTKKLNISEMQNVAKERGGKCLSKRYVNSQTYLKWRCAKGHIWRAVPASVKAGTWCPVCARLG